MTWPNRISILRICLIPVFVILLSLMGEQATYRYFALGIFGAMALSDALDGYLARRLNRVTEFGKLVDPLGDKVLLVASYWAMSSIRFFDEPPIPIMLSIVVISRDFYLATGFMILYLITGKRVSRVTRLGKASTVFQMSSILAVLVGLFPTPFLYGLFMATGIVTVASGAQYTYIGVRALESFEKGEEKARAD
jgi:cardiolipin synthase